MTRLILLITACQLTALNGTCQEIKYLTISPQNGGRAVSLQALNIERGAQYPSVIQLKGNVEIKTPVCLPVGRRRALVRDGEMILHADAAEFHEDTGEIRASGNVSVTPLRHRKKPATQI